MMTFMHVVTMMRTDGEYNFSSGLEKNHKTTVFFLKQIIQKVNYFSKFFFFKCRLKNN